MIKNAFRCLTECINKTRKRTEAGRASRCVKNRLIKVVEAGEWRHVLISGGGGGNVGDGGSGGGDYYNDYDEDDDDDDGGSGSGDGVDGGGGGDSGGGGSGGGGDCRGSCGHAVLVTVVHLCPSLYHRATS